MNVGDAASDYWKTRYTQKEAISHHAEQNQAIAKDFLYHARQRKPFADALSLNTIIEIGCGTGELAKTIYNTYGTRRYYATDFSREAVHAAQHRHPNVNFWVFDILRDAPFKYFELLISSNTLEHFSNPHLVIEKMFDCAPLLLLIVPYSQPITDGFDAEGGAGHVATLDEHTFAEYDLVDSFTFETVGWSYSSEGEKPLQYAVLLHDSDT